MCLAFAFQNCPPKWPFLLFEIERIARVSVKKWQESKKKYEIKEGKKKRPYSFTDYHQEFFIIHKTILKKCIFSVLVGGRCVSSLACSFGWARAVCHLPRTDRLHVRTNIYIKRLISIMFSFPFLTSAVVLSVVLLLLFFYSSVVAAKLNERQRKKQKPLKGFHMHMCRCKHKNPYHVLFRRIKSDLLVTSLIPFFAFRPDSRALVWCFFFLVILSAFLRIFFFFWCTSFAVVANVKTNYINQFDERKYRRLLSISLPLLCTGPISWLLFHIWSKKKITICHFEK